MALPPVSFALEAAALWGRAGVSRSAAALSYFLILTLFPLLLCVSHLIGLFHLDFRQLLAGLDQVLPAQALALMEEYLAYVAGRSSGTLFWAGLAAILLSASAGLRTLLHTMDELYQVQRRPGLGRVVLSLFLSLLFLATIYLSVAVIFTGDWFFLLLEARLPPGLARLIPLAGLGRLWRWLRYLLLFCFVLLLVLVVYRAGVPKKLARDRVVFLSALATALALAVSSTLFSWLIGMSSRYALVYGSLASLMVLLVWLYFCGSVLLLGAVAARVWQRRQG